MQNTYRQVDAAKRRAPAIGRSAGRRMSRIVNIHLLVKALSGRGICRQVIDPVKPGDVVLPSRSIRENDIKSLSL